MVLVTERFSNLAKVILRSKRIPESTVVTIPGNPEYVSKEELVNLADNVLSEGVKKLTHNLLQAHHKEEKPLEIPLKN